MPFTLSHAAAALPFRRSPLIPSALAVGCFAPDIEYFMRLYPGGGWGHTIAGAFGQSLPLGLITLWLFHNFVKVPAATLCPVALQSRLEKYLHPFPFGGVRRFLTIIVSLLVGIGSHIFWDSCTHRTGWLVQHHLRFLLHQIKMPVIGWFQYVSMLSWLSSLGGLLILGLWFARWYRQAEVCPYPAVRHISVAHKLTILALMTAICTLGGIMRSLIRTGLPYNLPLAEIFAGGVIVTFMALFWWQLVFWGFLLRPRSSRREMHDGEPAMRDGTSDAA